MIDFYGTDGQIERKQRIRRRYTLFVANNARVGRDGERRSGSELDAGRLWQTIDGGGCPASPFATAAELYQLVSTGATFTSPDPNLKPDNDLAAELRLPMRWITDGQEVPSDLRSARERRGAAELRVGIRENAIAGVA